MIKLFGKKLLVNLSSFKENIIADITKCSGENCLLKDTCFRFTATANEYRQSYFMTIPLKFVYKNVEGVRTENLDCDEYWERK